MEENLKAGAYLSRSAQETRRQSGPGLRALSQLGERKSQVAGRLSGGEQQMLATARALMHEAKLLAIDEPSLGLAPRVREELFAADREDPRAGHAGAAGGAGSGAGLPAWRGAITCSRKGRIIAEGSAEKMMADETLRAGYLGL